MVDKLFESLSSISYNTNKDNINKGYFLWHLEDIYKKELGDIGRIIMLAKDIDMESVKKIVSKLRHIKRVGVILNSNMKSTIDRIYFEAKFSDDEFNPNHVISICNYLNSNIKLESVSSDFEDMVSNIRSVDDLLELFYLFENYVSKLSTIKERAPHDVKEILGLLIVDVVKDFKLLTMLLINN